MAPGDKDIIDDLLAKTNTGESVFSAQSFADVLNKWFSLWEKNQDILIDVNSEVVQYYSRENQAMALGDIINNL
jgi:hypothetical protein